MQDECVFFPGRMPTTVVASGGCLRGSAKRAPGKLARLGARLHAGQLCSLLCLSFLTSQQGCWA